MCVKLLISCCDMVKISVQYRVVIPYIKPSRSSFSDLRPFYRNTLKSEIAFFKVWSDMVSSYGLDIKPPRPQVCHLQSRLCESVGLHKLELFVPFLSIIDMLVLTIVNLMKSQPFDPIYQIMFTDKTNI